MNNHVKLSVTDQVPFQAYQTLGKESAILLATDENAEEFFFNSCINCRLRNPKGNTEFSYICDYTPWFPGQDVFYTQFIPIDVNDTTQEDIITRVMEYLDLGIYVAGIFNEKYIPHKSAYKKRDFRHGFFIYGYNQNEHLFYALGYTDRLKFEFYPIAFSDFAQGFLGLKEPRFEVHFRNREKKLEFNLQQVYDELGDYLRSDYTINRAIGKHKNDLYGIRAHQAFRSYVARIGQENGFLDVRFSRFFFENKEFMLKRLSFLYQKGYIKDYSQKYSAVAQKSKIIHFLFLKYNMTRRPAILESIDCLLAEINQMDEEVLFAVYEDLTEKSKREKEEIYL